MVVFYQHSLVVRRDCEAEELANGVVSAVDFVVLGGKGLEEKAGEGGGGDLGGGEAEDVSDLTARIELRELCPLEGRVAIFICSCNGKWESMDHSKGKKQEGVAVYLAIASNLSKKFRIVVFEHFTHQLVIVLIDELVTVCMRK